MLIANDRKEGSVREPKEAEKMLRIFIKIPKGKTEKDVEDSFKVSYCYQTSCFTGAFLCIIYQGK